MFVYIFLKVLKPQAGHWNLQIGHNATRGSVIRHPWRKAYCYRRGSKLGKNCIYQKHSRKRLAR